MSSKIEIWSQVSVLLGNGVQQSLTANNEFINQITAVYDTTYESRLSTHRWGFARKKLALSKLAAAPLNEWESAYQIPADALSIFKVYPHSDYVIVGDKVYANASTLSVDYIFKPDNEGYLPAYFVEALVGELAAMLAYGITNNATLSNGLIARAARGWMTAWNADSAQRPSEEIVDQPLIWARYG